MLTNKQMIIIGVFCLAMLALIMGCEFEDIVRLLPILLGMG
jgi:hypothetical protein